jgi:cytochrome c-type biogenesis protein
VDATASAIGSLARGSAWAWPLVFIAGAVSSLGPCASPRLVALAALVVRSRHPHRVGAVFIGSTIATYACFGLVGTAVADLVGCASWIYVGVALAALAAGTATLIGAAWHHHAHVPQAPRRSALSAAFLAGVGFALMVSPCCTPILGVIIAASSLRGNVPLGIGLLAVFGLGHAAPLLVVLAGGRAAVVHLWSSRWAQGMQVGAGTCMLALGAYYALLV